MDWESYMIVAVVVYVDDILWLMMDHATTRGICGRDSVLKEVVLGLAVSHQYQDFVVIRSLGGRGR